MEKPLPFPSQPIPSTPESALGFSAHLRELSNKELEVEHQAQILEQTLRELAREPERLMAMRTRLEAAARSIGLRRSALQTERQALETSQAVKRSARRVDRPVIAVQVSPSSQHTFWTDVTGDVRTGGLFIATRDMLPSSTRLRIRLSLPGRKPRTVMTEVVWQREPSDFTRDLPPGLGLKLLDPDLGLLSDIQAFTRHCPALVFELVA